METSHAPHVARRCHSVILVPDGRLRECPLERPLSIRESSRFRLPAAIATRQTQRATAFALAFGERIA